MFKFIHSADLHLDSPMIGLQRYESAPADEIRGATRRALENLVSLAIEEDAAFVLIAGDLYDGEWKDYNTALFFGRQMSRLRERNINVYVSAGNHDAASVITKKLNPTSNVTIMSSKKVETKLVQNESLDIKVAIHGLSFASREETANPVGRFPSPIKDFLNIGLLHTSAEGSDRHTSYAPCGIHELAATGYDYWALGHVHNRNVLREEPWIVFSGNTQGRHIRESGSKGCTLATVEEGKVVAIEHCELDVVRWVDLKVDVSGAKVIDDVISLVSSELNEIASTAGERLMAVRVTVIGACAAHDEIMKSVERFETEIYQTASEAGSDRIWIEKIYIKTKGEMDIGAIAERDDAAGSFLRSLQSVSADDTELMAFLQNDDAFKKLFLKLPLPIKEGDDPIDPANPEMFKQVIEDAKDILISRVFQWKEGE